MSHLENLLQQCTVKLSLPERTGWGTGFFVAPGWILTCAHVVPEANGQPVQVQWQKIELEAIVERSLPDPYDLALLRVSWSANCNPPCVYLDEEVRSRDPLYLFGYPDEGDRQGEPRTFRCDGITGSDIASILFNLGQVRPGMSGSPLLNQRTGKVCGMVKFTRDRSIDLGGGAIPTRVILAQFPELQELQRQFHQQHPQWLQIAAQHPQPIEINFQPYLQSIATTYAKWWQLYTLIDAEGKQRQQQESAPMFDFGLMVQTIQKPEQEQPQSGQSEQEKEKIERFSVLEGLRKYALGEKPEHVLLVGRPGAGKSTALARLMLEEAQKSEVPQTSEVLKTSEVSAHSLRIPVLVELRYWQGSIAQLILDTFARHERPLTAEQLETVLARSLILFDGVNELPSEEARSQLMDFRRNHAKLPMIFTTRDLSLGGDLGIERKLEMQPLTEAQMQAFIRAYIPGQAEAMLRQLKDRLREFGQTPLLLWMLCSLFQQTGQMPENLGLVFRAFTQSYDRQLKPDVVIESDREWWQPVLQQLTGVMMQGKKPTELRVAIAREEAVGAIGQFLKDKVPYAEDFARKCLRDLQKHHLIQAGSNPNELEFRHQLLQEYYAAESLLRQLPTLTDEQLKQEYLNYLKWTEPVALMLALLDSEVQAVRVVQQALAVDFRLGARLAGEVKPAFQPQTIPLVEALQVPSWLKVQLLGETRSECSIAGLIEAITDSDSWVAIPGLLEAIADSDYHVRWSAVEDLGKLRRPVVLPPLFVIEDLNASERRRAAENLGKLGSEAAIPALLNAIEHSDYHVRRGAAEALGKLGSEVAIPALLNAIADSDGHVSWIAEEALVKLGSDAAIPALLQKIEHSDYYVRRSAARVLGSVAKNHADVLSSHLSHLLALIPTASGEDAHDVILAIQANCKFYNYEIFQAYLTAQNADRQTPKSYGLSPGFHP